jgi:integrase
MQGKIGKRAVDSLPIGASLADTEIRGFTARRLPSGLVTYGFRYRDKPSGQARWLSLGLHGQAVTPYQARELARKAAGAVADRRDPVAEQRTERAAGKRAAAATVDALLDAFLERHVRPKLRTAAAVERALDVYVRPALGGVSIYQLKRSHIAAVLDAVETRGGPVAADHVLAYIRTAFTWWATRDDDFSSPIVRGMARTKGKDRARSRVLTDDEIRELWQALDQGGVSPAYSRLFRALLLTGQRRGEVAGAPWSEIDGDVWTITAERYKTKRPHAVPLTRAVRDLFGEKDAGGRCAGDGFCFSNDGGRNPITGFSKAKAALDRQIASRRKAEGREGMPPWRLHDLRRTARSLMSRAGVPADVAERVLGHVIPGMRGVYDRHAYEAEKRTALEKLAALVGRIVNPVENVIPMRQPG